MVARLPAAVAVLAGRLSSDQMARRCCTFSIRSSSLSWLNKLRHKRVMSFEPLGTLHQNDPGAASVARMSAATCESIERSAPDFAIARRKTRVIALMAHPGYARSVVPVVPEAQPHAAKKARLFVFVVHPTPLSLVSLLRRLSRSAAEESGNRHSKRLVKRLDG